MYKKNIVAANLVFLYPAVIRITGRRFKHFTPSFIHIFLHWYFLWPILPHKKYLKSSKEAIAFFSSSLKLLLTHSHYHIVIMVVTTRLPICLKNPECNFELWEAYPINITVKKNTWEPFQHHSDEKSHSQFLHLLSITLH